VLSLDSFRFLTQVLTEPDGRRGMTQPTDRSGTEAGRTATGAAGPDRRQILLRGAAGALVGTALSGSAWPVGAIAQAAPALPDAGASFTAATLPDLARALAARPYVAPRTDDLPDALRSLTREQYAAIRTVPAARIWETADLGFTLEPLHRGFVYTDPVSIALVEDGTVRPLAYARDRFETGGLTLPESAQDPGFSGFRVRARFGGDALSDFAIFQGASFFRLVARGQGFGLNARALTLRPADSRGEEFPRWRAFFIEKPGIGGPLVVHALIDSESAVGALRLTLRPGDASVVDVEGTIVTRAAIDHLGLAAMQTSYLFGAHDQRGADDARAGAYASGGLQIRNGGGEAIWRPVRNPPTLQISSFIDEDPKGFGLMQRARDYATFEDDVQHWEWRPSLWVEPLGAAGVEGLWGAGAVTLLEIPSDSELNENVLAYWRPKVSVPARTEARFSYRQVWCWQPSTAPPVAIVSGTRSGRGSQGPRRRFVVDFTGDILFPEGAAQNWEIVLLAGPGTITAQTLYPYPDRRTVRVAFELDPGGERASELRLALKVGGRQLTETWLYRWTA